MPELTQLSEAALKMARQEAGNSTDATAYAVVSALKGVAYELAALREELALTPAERHLRYATTHAPTIH